MGRKPNADDLGLEAAGVAVDKRGYIIVDDQLRTNVPGVWAMGDCNGKGAFTHTAYSDFEIFAANLLDDDPRKVSDRLTAYALYIDPPLARVGMTEAEVRATGRPALVGTRPMTRVGRAIERGETQGFMKVVVDAETNQVLGAAILGVGGDEAIHGILEIMYAKAPYTTLQRAVHIHPTVSELIPTEAEQNAAKVVLYRQTLGIQPRCQLEQALGFLEIQSSFGALRLVEEFPQEALLPANAGAGDGNRTHDILLGKQTLYL